MPSNHWWPEPRGDKSDSPGHPQRTNSPQPKCVHSTTGRRDNSVVRVPTGYVNQAHIGEIIAEAAQHLGPEVVHVAYSLGPDSTGEPSLFFRILLDDAYIREETIADVTRRIGAALFDATRPVENWGLRPYFNFRSKSEQDRRRDPDWV
jgi:hypothetical protein